MPWKETGPMKERVQLVSLYETGNYSVTQLAEGFGVSRKTAYKWLDRFRQEGVGGIEERSRAPHHHPNATKEEVVLAVLRAKAAHPSWGPAKLQPGTQEPREVVEAWPAPSTRGAILARHGLVTPRRRRRRVTPWSQPFLYCNGPNTVWCADFKGWCRTGDGQRCDPLTISDAFSRMFLGCQIVAKTDYAHVREVFEGVFQEYPPQADPRPSARIMARLLLAWVWADCRPWPCGGSSWGLCPNALPQAIQSKTAGMNGCTAPSNRRPCGRPPPIQRPSSSDMIPSVRSITP